MARSGWDGHPPKSDVEARLRIVEATILCIDRYGSNRATLSDVAAELGVTRQTVYRYFEGTEQLFAAVSRVGADAFLDRLAVDLAHIEDATEVVVEAIAITIERLPKDPYLGLVLSGGRSQAFLLSATSAEAMQLARRLLHSLPVRWNDDDTGDREINMLAEFGLRMIQSLVLDTGTTKRSPEELRDFLRFWLEPALSRAGAIE